MFGPNTLWPVRSYEGCQPFANRYDSDSRIFHFYHDCSAAVCYHRPSSELLIRVYWHCTPSLGRSCLLFCFITFPHHLSSPWLCLEIVSWNSTFFGWETDWYIAIDAHTTLLPIISCRKFKSSASQTTDLGKNSKHHQPCNLCWQKYRFQKAIKKVRATQRMRRQRGFAFSQTETNNQDQARLIRAYDTSVARPSGY